jgi:hypothetical protein
MRKSSLTLFAVLIVTVCPSYTRADTIGVFSISGTSLSSCLYTTGVPILNCTPNLQPFAGALEVDVTTGTAITIQLLGPVLGTFTSTILGQPITPVVSPSGNGGVRLLTPSPTDPLTTYLEVDFTTATPGSLVGFDGGTIVGWPSGHSGVFDISSFNFPFVYILSGSITPVTVPEPSSLTLIMLGLAGLVVMRKRMGHRGQLPV